MLTPDRPGHVRRCSSLITRPTGKSASCMGLIAMQPPRQGEGEYRRPGATPTWSLRPGVGPGPETIPADALAAARPRRKPAARRGLNRSADSLKLYRSAVDVKLATIRGYIATPGSKQIVLIEASTTLRECPMTIRPDQRRNSVVDHLPEFAWGCRDG
jgi:hypothetical protein